jgi:3-oxoacyl-[acyl-carrier protein] reductase
MKSAFITGGTRGIGLGIARALAREGWTLALGGQRSEPDVASERGELRALGVEVHYIRGDLSQTQDRGRMLAEVRASIGVPNALVNNAGRAPRARIDLLEATEASFDEVLRTNLQGPYFLTQAIARDLVDRRRADPSFTASIVFVTSVSAEGIPVFEVRPGVIATDMTAGVREVYDRRIADGLIPEARWGQPDDVGRAVAALVRGDVPYATGTIVNVDGGLSIPRL